MKKKRFLLWSHIHTKRKTTKKIHSKRKILEQLIQRELHVRADQEWDWFWCFDYWYSISWIFYHADRAPHFITVRSVFIVDSIFNILSGFSICMQSIIEYRVFFRNFSLKFWKKPYIYQRYYFYWIPSRFHPNLTPNELLKIVFLQH